MQPLRLTACAAAVLAVAFSSPALGQDTGVPALDTAIAAEATRSPAVLIVIEDVAGAEIDTSAVIDAASPFGAAPIEEATLRSIAGREDVNQASYANQVAGVSKNSVGNDSVTGNTEISGNAFQNMSGLSILNVNSGNNVAINASMNVNISFVAAP